ncbi:hypothetical protein OB2597_18456 [Pseudooceanicola batsensis HTCC2597]|uniref:Uncharacterized protein n=1 Tax=Pseudooceanicola batsensis (strain ATCC BAA-863 / DSM 15984 / KCTC 12145 / HTCC2597) TaxID=252305 RepID=A3U3D6_PSEBH|nr:hypothetical protein OB2597_18456 [Pseudooceanicola batsensis HTCC2597]
MECNFPSEFDARIVERLAGNRQVGETRLVGEQIKMLEVI